MEKDDISPCPKCHCMTKSIREGRAKYKCGKCGADKSLSDVYFYVYEVTHKKTEPKKAVSK
jgi:DNA-directed RNA polymerase subunit M/transcription elongation factor TFIIS